MLEAMNKVVQANADLTVEERNLLSEGQKESKRRKKQKKEQSQ